MGVGSQGKNAPGSRKYKPILLFGTWIKKKDKNKKTQKIFTNNVHTNNTQVPIYIIHLDITSFIFIKTST